MDSLNTDEAVRKKIVRKLATKQLESTFFNSFQSTCSTNESRLMALNALLEHYQGLYPQDYTACNNQPPKSAIPVEEQLQQLKVHSAALHNVFTTTAPEILIQRLFQTLNRVKGTLMNGVIDAYPVLETPSCSLFSEKIPGANAWFFQIGTLIRNHRLTPNWENTFCQQLSNEALKDLARSFNCKERAAIVNSVFYFKLYPAELLNPGYSAPQLLMTKKLLEDLHDNAKRLFRAVKHSAAERCQLRIFDYIFQGLELPEGMRFVARADHAHSIKKVLSDYPIKVPADTAVIVQNPMHALLRAYKFWFNPNRLIDAMMGMWNSSTAPANERKTPLRLFSCSLQRYYQALSTSECIDLFGYFSNKSSQYFYRCLQAAIDNSAPEALPPCSAQDKKIIRLIATLFLTLVQQLQKELQARNISTDALVINSARKPRFLPGKRNRRAIEHIIARYSTIEHRPNQTLEALFNTIEGKN